MQQLCFRQAISNGVFSCPSPPAPLAAARARAHTRSCIAAVFQQVGSASPDSAIMPWRLPDQAGREAVLPQAKRVLAVVFLQAGSATHRPMLGKRNLARPTLGPTQDVEEEAELSEQSAPDRSAFSHSTPPAAVTLMEIASPFSSATYVATARL